MKKSIHDKTRKTRRMLLPLLLLACVLPAAAQPGSTVFDRSELDSLRHTTADVAYGKQAREAVTASLSTVYREDLLKRNTTSLARALTGQLPGLNVRSLSGVPDAEAELTIRGSETYNSTQPLVVVDGFRTDYVQISLYEIESISILKDASATVLYGMEAANGVLLITTRRGKAGPLTVQAQVQYGIQEMAQLPELLNAAQFATYYNQALVNDGLNRKYDPVNDIPNYGKGGDYRYTHPDNDYFGRFLRKFSPVLNAGLNFNGGTEIARYNATVSYLGNSGALAGAHTNDYSTQLRRDKVNIRTNLDVNLMKGLWTSVGAAVSFDNNNYPGVSTPSLFDAMQFLPPQAFPLRNPDGSLGGTSTYRNNPLGMISESGYQTSLKRNIDVSLRLGYDFAGALEGLSLELAGAIATTMTVWDNKVKQYETYSMDQPNDLENTTYTKHGSLTDLSWQTDVLSYKRITFQPAIRYSRRFGKHAVDALLMGNMDRYTQNLANTTPYNYDNAGAGLRVAYGLSDKYFAEAGLSYYGQEQYRKGNRFKFFPSVSAGWILSKEEFLKESGAVDYLKIKASYGVVGGGSGLLFDGSKPADRLHYNQYYLKTGGSSFGETNSYAPSSAGYILGYLANPDITADKSHKFNVGVETTLFNHIDLKAEYFHNKRTGILTNDGTIPGTLGFSGRTRLVNGGEVKNQGFEIALQVFGKAGDFEYNVSGSLAYNKSELVKKPDVTPLHGIDNRSGIGMPVGQIFGYQVIGFYESDEAAQNAKVKQTFGPTQAGDAIYADLTGDDVIDISDAVALGYSLQPRYNYTIGIDLKYRQFYFSALGQGIAKSSVMQTNMIPFANQGNAFRTFAENSWSPDHTAGARYPRLSTASVANNNQASTAWLYSRDYFKLRNVEVGYEFSCAGLRKLGVGSAKVYLMGIDLFTHAKELKHIDPESLSVYPPMKSYNIGLRLAF